MEKTTIRKTNIAIIVLSILIAVALYFADSAKAPKAGSGDHPHDSVAAFYAGATIKWIIPNNPGGGYDEYARLIAPYLEKYTGARVQLRNIPGSGGMRALGELYKSPTDGLTISLINGAGMVTGQVAEINNADPVIGSLSFIGRVTTDTRVLTVAGRSAYSSFGDIMAAEDEVRIGATGFGGSTYVDAVVIREVFGLNMNVIHGFNNSSGMRHAMLRGKIDGAWSSWGSVMDEVVSGQIKIALQGGRTRAAHLPDVPTVFEFMDKTTEPLLAQKVLTAWDALHAVGRLVAAPFGIPSDRLTFLREAFSQALHDPQFLDDAMQAGRPILFASGEQMEIIVRSTSQVPVEIQQVFVKALRSEL